MNFSRLSSLWMMLVALTGCALAGCPSAELGSDICAKLYQHSKCGGDHINILAWAGGGWYSSTAGGDDKSLHTEHNWGDRVSSIVVRKGCSLQVFEHADFQGESKWYHGPYEGGNLEHGWGGGPNWNDRISSVKCFC